MRSFPFASEGMAAQKEADSMEKSISVKVACPYCGEVISADNRTDRMISCSQCRATLWIHAERNGITVVDMGRKQFEIKYLVSGKRGGSRVEKHDFADEVRKEALC